MIVTDEHGFLQDSVIAAMTESCLRGQVQILSVEGEAVTPHAGRTQGRWCRATQREFGNLTPA